MPGPVRIQVVSPLLPRPDATHGGAVYLGSLLEALGRHADVGLVTFVRQSELRWKDQPAAGLAAVTTVPLPQRYDLERQRHLVLHQVRMLRHWGPGRLPLAAAKYRAPRMRAEIQAMQRTLRPDVVLVEFAIMAQYLGAIQPTAATVMTDHEHGERPAAAVGPFGWGRNRDGRLWRRYLRRQYRRASLVQALNHEDAASLARILDLPVEIRPPVVPTPKQIVHPDRAPPRALFLGDYTHHPNPESALFLARRLWPLVRARCPEAELWLAGPRATPEVRALGELPGVRVCGFVDDLAGLLADVRVLLAPLFSGGGTRIKVMTALAHGLPVVSNALGLRGVGAPQPAATSAESIPELVDATVPLLTDDDRVRAAGVAAREWAIGHHSADALAEQQIERFERLIHAQKQH